MYLSCRGVPFEPATIVAGISHSTLEIDLLPNLAYEALMRVDRDKVLALVAEYKARAVQLWQQLLARAKAWQDEAMTDTVRPRVAPDSLEGQLGVDMVKDLLASAAEKMLRVHVPVLTDQRVLEVGESAGRFSALLSEHGARMIVANEIGPLGTAAVAELSHQVHVVRANTLRLPYCDTAFDYVVANYLSLYQGDLTAALKEVSRTMTPGAGVILFDFHPFANFARRGTARVKPLEANFRGIGDYYKAARNAGLRVQEVHEGFIDETLRPQFVTPEQKQVYRAQRDKPLVLAVVARKGVGG